MIAQSYAEVDTLSGSFDLEQIQIDEKFKILCPALSDEELRQLRDNIVADCEFREPLTVWGNEGILLDGHNRLDVWNNLSDHERHLVGTPEISLLDFASREEAHNWIITNQLGRRNLSTDQKSYLVGKRYKAEKKNKKENLKRGNTPAKSPKGQNVPSGNTAETIGKEVGKTGKQVKRDAKYAEAVDTIAENVGQEAKQEILNGPKKLAKSKVIEIAALPADKQQAAFDRAMGRGEPSGGTSFDPSEWGGYDTVEEPVVASGVITEHHLKEMQAPFREVQKNATALKKAINKLPEGPGGDAWYNPNAMQDILTCYTNLMTAIKSRKPVAVCGHCGGKKCDRCMQTGVLNKDRAETLKDGLEITGTV